MISYSRYLENSIQKPADSYVGIKGLNKLVPLGLGLPYLPLHLVITCVPCRFISFWSLSNDDDDYGDASGCVSQDFKSEMPKKEDEMKRKGEDEGEKRTTDLPSLR